MSSLYMLVVPKDTPRLVVQSNLSVVDWKGHGLVVRVCGVFWVRSPYILEGLPWVQSGFEMCFGMLHVHEGYIGTSLDLSLLAESTTVLRHQLSCFCSVKRRLLQNCGVTRSPTFWVR